MPNKPKRACNIPGCSEYAVNRSQYCKSHIRNNKRQKWGKHNPFYDTSAWRNLRNAFIRVNKLCKHCADKGIIREATQVDHIRSIENGGDPLSWDNLQPLCTSCHAAKTSQEIKDRV